MHGPWLKSILFKICASLIVLEVCVLVPAGGYGLRWFRRQVQRQIEERVVVPGRWMAGGRLGAEAAADPKTLEELIGIDWVELADAIILESGGNILYSSNPALTNQNAFQHRLLDSLWICGKAEHAILGFEAERSHYTTCYNLVKNATEKQPALYFYLKVKTDRAERTIRNVWIFFVVGLLGCGGLTGLVVWIVFRYFVTGRISSLISVLRRVEQGDLNARFKGLLRNDEIGLVQKHANAIVVLLQETIQTLENRLFDLKESEQERERMQVQFYQAQKMEALGVLTGGVAHDFNNLLTAIQGCADMALFHAQETDPLYADLKEIQVAARRASDLTHQLLLFSRKQTMKYVPLDLNKVIDGLYKMLHRLIGEDIGISTPTELDLWTVHADRSCMEQVIINLAVNAKDSMKHGGMLTVRTENVDLDERSCQSIPESHPGRFVRLIVADTGSGIEPHVLEHIFEPFFSTKEPGKGTGLGLSVVYGIVQQHGGFIHVSSQQGRGSVFEIYLPAVVENADTAPDELSPNLDAFRGNGEKILIVEDEKGVRDFLRSILERSGYVVQTASTVAEALDLFEKHKQDFQLVFADVVLPDRNGVDLADELLERKPDLGVLMGSGYTDDKSQRNRILEKKYRFLHKPYRLYPLLKIIRDVLIMRKA